MKDGLADAELLQREQRCIELLSHGTHTAIGTVQQVFLTEYHRLEKAARIKSYLPLLTINSVRGILESANAVTALGAPVSAPT